MTEKRRDDRLVGTVLDSRFELERVLGAGGMGKVYAGRQLSVDRAVAVKVLREELSESESLTARFFREAKVVASLRHANIVGLVDFGKDDERGLLYIAMEYVDGIPLSKLMKAGRFDAALAVTVIRQICSALAEAHAAGVIHRDLKPDNVMLVTTAEGALSVKVLDFGIALPTGEEARLTNTGAVVGTPFYMAPEQAQDKPVTSASDIYSLGVMLFEMLSGELPFMADTPMAVLLKAISTAPPPLDTILGPDDMPPNSLTALLGEMLQKKPEDRPPSVAVVGRRLDEIVRQAQLSAPHAASTEELTALVIDRDATQRGLADTAASPVPTPSAAPAVAAPIVTPVPADSLRPKPASTQQPVAPPVPPKKSGLPSWWPGLLAIPIGCLCTCLNLMDQGDRQPATKPTVADVVVNVSNGGINTELVIPADLAVDGGQIEMPEAIPFGTTGVDADELREIRDALDKANRALDDDPTNDPHELRNLPNGLIPAPKAKPDSPAPAAPGMPEPAESMLEMQMKAGGICQLPRCDFLGTRRPGAASCQGKSKCTAQCEVSGCPQICSDSADCDFNCQTGNCDQTCAGSATCDFTCDGGNCAQKCVGNARCTMRCPGGNCAQQCATGRKCKTSCSGGSCG